MDSEIHLIFHISPLYSALYLCLTSCFWSVSLDNSFQTGCQREHNRWHPRCFFRSSLHICSYPNPPISLCLSFSPHLFLCCSSLTLSPPHPPPSSSLASTISFALRLLPLLSHLPLCPNKSLIFPMMISLINLDKATGCSVPVEHETLAGTGGDIRWGMALVHEAVLFFWVFHFDAVLWERAFLCSRSAFFCWKSLEGFAEVLILIISVFVQPP